jgi:hypothetical protein
MAVSPNTAFTAGQILTAQQQNNFPRGVMGYAISTVNSVVTTSVTDITGMSITFTAVANRLYRATFSGFCQQSSNSRIFLTFADGSGVQKDFTLSGLSTAGANAYTAWGAQFLFTTTAGSTTRKMQGSVDTGTASFLGATADARTYSFIIEDMGPV